MFPSIQIRNFKLKIILKGENDDGEKHDRDKNCHL